MLRRSFLQRAGLVIAGGVATSDPASKTTAAERGLAPRPRAVDSGKVLVTSAGSKLCNAIAGQLNDDWEVRVTGPREIETRFSFRLCDFNDDDSLSAALEGVEAVVHLAQSPDVRGTELIDYRTRQTYNLLRAAAAMGVQRIIHLSSLEIMLGYDERFMITEDFRPRPTPDTQPLSHYLGEFTCREFARAGELDVAVLRLGRLNDVDDTPPAASDLPRTAFRDVAQAVTTALGSREMNDRPKLGPWNVLHIHSEIDSTRFPLNKAQRLLRYRPLTMEGDA